MTSEPPSSPESPSSRSERGKNRRPLVFFAIIGGVGLLLGVMIGYPCAMMLNNH